MTSSQTRPRARQQNQRVACVILILIGIALTGCSGGGGKKVRKAKLSGYEPTFPVNTEREPSIVGVWSQAELGMFIEFDASGAHYYQRADNFCWPEAVPSLDEYYKKWFAEYAIMSDASSIMLRPAKGETPYELSFRQELPASCAAVHSRLDIFDIFTSLMRTHYPAFERRGVNFFKQSADVRRELTSLETDDDLLASMGEALAGLDDPGLVIRAPDFSWEDPESESEEMKNLREAFLRQDVYKEFDSYVVAWYEAVRERLKNTLTVEHFTAIDGALFWGVLPDGTGYTQIVSLESGSEDDWRQALRDMFRYHRDRSTLLLDLSMLSGVREQIAQMLTSAIVGDGQTLFTTRYFQVPEGEWIAHKSGDKKLMSDDQPLYVLTSNETAGAAEHIVLALRGRPGVTQVGSTTRGAMAMPFFRSLPNGWLLQMGAVEVADAGNVSYEGIGLAPDFALTLFPAGQISQGHHAAVQTLADLIADGHFAEREKIFIPEDY